MNYGDIIKRSWHITWRYKALWVLGIFAGVSGCQGGTGSNYSRSGSRDFQYFSFGYLMIYRYNSTIFHLLSDFTI